MQRPRSIIDPTAQDTKSRRLHHQQLQLIGKSFSAWLRVKLMRGEAEWGEQLNSCGETVPASLALQLILIGQILKCLICR